MMNDFTKEELGTILLLIDDDLNQDDGYVYVTDYREKLRDKVNNMIDNYCEQHEADEFENLDICKYCDKRFR